MLTHRRAIIQQVGVAALPLLWFGKPRITIHLCDYYDIAGSHRRARGEVIGRSLLELG